tara:strand:- start:5138 stop:5275 length:138 start_codon:yes stop_codon:yes gene_type:complete
MSKNKIEDPIVRELANGHYWEGFYTGAAIATVVIGANILIYLLLL